MRFGEVHKWFELQTVIARVAAITHAAPNRKNSSIWILPFTSTLNEWTNERKFALMADADET